MPAFLNKKQQGIQHEKTAANYLQKQGLYLLEQNYYCPFGEIDLIMRHNNEIVFVEVRLRTQPHCGDAFESVDSGKQQRIYRSAMYYLQRKNLLDKVNCRFDVIGFSAANIDWVQDAFCYE